MCTDFLLKNQVHGQEKTQRLSTGARWNSAWTSSPGHSCAAAATIMQSRTPDKTRARNGLRWTVKYGYVGMDALWSCRQVVDGLNERGLSVGTLWLPGSEYQKVTRSRPGAECAAGQRLAARRPAPRSPTSRTRCPTVEVWAYKPMEQKLSTRFTSRCTTRSGNSIVIEYTAGKLHIYDNPIATTTNAPVFPWHLENVRNYVGLTPYDVTEATVNGTVFHGNRKRHRPARAPWRLHAAVAIDPHAVPHQFGRSSGGGRARGTKSGAAHSQ